MGEKFAALIAGKHTDMDTINGMLLFAILIVAAISFMWNIYTWGSDMSSDASQTPGTHASRFCGNLMFASVGVMVIFGIVSALRLCGFTFNIPAM